MIASGFNVRAKESQGIREFYGDDIALLKLAKKVKMSTHARCLSGTGVHPAGETSGVLQGCGD